MASLPSNVPVPQSATNNGSGFPRTPVVLIALCGCATSLAEATSNYLMPDTIHRITQNAFIISVILSLNPLFGFVAQPLAGWYSDQVRSPFGRRKPLIVASAVLLAASCLGLPWSAAMARGIPGFERVVAWLGHADISAELAMLSFWILVYQFVVDVLAIMNRCLIADLIPPQHRAKTFAATHIAGTVVSFAALRWAGGIAAGGEWRWYAVVALGALLAVLPLTLFLREPEAPTKPARTEDPSRWADYLRGVRETPHFLPMCLVIACSFVALQLITNYYRLFTKEQLELDLQAALAAFSWMPLVALIASAPVGWLSDRYSEKYVTQAGVLLLAAAGLVGIFADSIGDLRFMAVLCGLGLVATDIGGSSYLIGLLPRERIGQLSGFANIFRGGPRFLMFFGAGALIELFDRNYRVAFVGAVLLGLAAFVLMAFLPRNSRRGAP